MTPADIVKVDRLADAVCHREQMDIWQLELLQGIEEWVDFKDHDDLLALHQATGRAIRFAERNSLDGDYRTAHFFDQSAAAIRALDIGGEADD